jgi:hypothetical protein
MTRKRGRPPLDVTDPSVTLTIRLPSKQLAALTRQAQARDESVAVVARRRLRTELRFFKSPAP